MGVLNTPKCYPKCATIFRLKMGEQESPIVFGEWLKLRRKALDLTQVELSKRVGCSLGAIRKIESGERRPSKQLAGLLAKALEIPSGDQQTFIRVARGELNLERLGQSSLESQARLPDVQSLIGTQREASFKSRPKPPLPTTHIPLQTTPLIGRDPELDAMERIFNNPQCRLLTLTGVGGIGKTRLAIEFAMRKQSEFPGGVFYIPLTSVNSSEKIVPAIADELDFRFSGSTDPKEQLLTYLSTHIIQEALLVLDNLEHLLAQISTSDDKSGVVELTSEILQRLPNVKILGTSRERMNLHGEWVYELHGLSVPPTNFVGRLEDYDSVALFMKSAQRIRPDFQLTNDEQSSLIKITQLVEGVPLAIELAAAWVGLLSCQEIAQEINSNMDFLTTSMRDIPERHRSIRATFDHSWKLLSDEERRVLYQLSVFQGGFDRLAADQIAGASLHLLASLNAKSLVRRDESARYDLHEVIRQYAASHIDDYPRDLRTNDRHCEYYLNFVRDREKPLKSASQQETMRQLIDEIDNIRTAWAWAIQHKKYAKLGQAGRGFGWYYEIAGLYLEGIDQLEMLVQALKAGPQDNQWDRVLGLALLHQALLFFRKGEFKHAQELYEESIVVLRPTGDQTLLMDALIFLGIILHLTGDYKRAKLSVEEGLIYARSNNDRWFEAYAILNLGYIASLMGNYEEGYDQMMVALDIWRKVGDPHYIALGMNFMVPTLNQLGRFEEAKSFMQESITLSEQSKNRWGLGTAYRYLGLACIGTGEFEEARAHLLKSLEIFRGFTEGWDIAKSLIYLGDATLFAGNNPEAGMIYREALQESIDSEAIPLALESLLGISNMQSQIGKTQSALVLCLYVLNDPCSESETISRAEQLRSILEPKLSPEQIKSALANAREKRFDSIVNEALQTA